MITVERDGVHAAIYSVNLDWLLTPDWLSTRLRGAINSVDYINKGKKADISISYRNKKSRSLTAGLFKAKPKRTIPLDPTIRHWSDLIYQVDQVRFKKLIVWIREAQADGFSIKVIASVLEAFYPHAATIKNWRAYLVALINKMEGKVNALDSQLEHEKLKRDEARYVKALSGGRGLLSTKP
jgi:hypothetical protein